MIVLMCGAMGCINDDETDSERRRSDSDSVAIRWQTRNRERRRAATSHWQCRSARQRRTAIMTRICIALTQAGRALIDSQGGHWFESGGPGLTAPLALQRWYYRERILAMTRNCIITRSLPARDDARDVSPRCLSFFIIPGCHPQSPPSWLELADTKLSNAQSN